MITAIVNEACAWGQSIFESPADGVIWWVDASHPGLFCFYPSNGRSYNWTVNEQIGFAYPVAKKINAEENTFIVGLNSGIGTGKVSGNALSVKYLAGLSPEASISSISSGTVDRYNRLWFTTQHQLQQTVSGHLYLYTKGKLPTKQAGPFLSAYGATTSRCGRKLYISIAEENKILEYIVAPSGNIQEIREVIQFKEHDAGIPTGLALAKNGNIWVCRYGLGLISEITPNGLIVQQIEMPTKSITDCCFGGAERRTLYVCSAAYGAPKSDKMAGATFAVNSGSRGEESFLLTNM